MPLYRYKCSCGNVFETFRSMKDRDTAPCDKCGKDAPKEITAPNIHFKGVGWSTEKSFWYTEKEARKEFPDQYSHKDFD